MIDGVTYDAVLSTDGVYRYLLRRTWDAETAPLVWVMLNPSTADADTDDATIRKIMKFTRAWCAGGVVVVNLYAYRATKPEAMYAAEVAGTDIVGPDNDRTLDRVLARAAELGTEVVAAWGTNDYSQRGSDVVAPMARRAGVRLWCLDHTKGGHPKHPLYVRDDQEPRLWR